MRSVLALIAIAVLIAATSGMWPAGPGRAADPAPPPVLEFQTITRAVAIGDLNGDRRDDVLFAGSEQLGALMAQPVGAPVGLDPAFANGLDPRDVALGDLDGDGDLDVVVGGGTTEFASESDREPLRYLTGAGDGSLQPVVDAFGMVGSPVTVNAIAIADVIGSPAPEVITGRSAGLRVYAFGDPVIDPFDQISAPLGSVAARSLAAGQLGGDAHADIALVEGPRLWTVTGGASLGPATAVALPAGPPPIVVRIADVAGDARPDLAILRSGASAQVQILPTGGPPLAPIATGAASHLLEIGDVDGDGRNDLVTAAHDMSCADPGTCPNDRSVRVLFGLRTHGRFSAPVALPLVLGEADNTVKITVGDIALGELEPAAPGLEIVAANDFDEARHTYYRGADAKPVEPDSGGGPGGGAPTGGGGATAGGAGTGGGTAGGATAGAPLTCAGRRVTITGTPAPDRLRGTAGIDVIAGRSGADLITGLGGGDVICGGPGNDRISGGPGRDQLLGETGRDRLDGGRGRDVAGGGPGRDRCLAEVRRACEA